jgi:hypothetical protein
MDMPALDLKLAVLLTFVVAVAVGDLQARCDIWPPRALVGLGI